MRPSPWHVLSTHTKKKTFEVPSFESLPQTPQKHASHTLDPFLHIFPRATAFGVERTQRDSRRDALKGRGRAALTPRRSPSRLERLARRGGKPRDRSPLSTARTHAKNKLFKKISVGKTLTDETCEEVGRRSHTCDWRVARALPRHESLPPTIVVVVVFCSVSPITPHETAAAVSPASHFHARARVQAE